MMGINELHELINKALADGKQVLYHYYSNEHQWQRITSAKIKGDNFVFAINYCDYKTQVMNIFVDDQSEIDDFIARVAIYDELHKPRDVVLGTNKRVIKDTNSEYPLTLTEAIGVYKAHSNSVEADGWKTRYIVETDYGMRFIE